MSIFVFQVEVEDDPLENPLEISITRSPVKRRPRLGDQSDVRAIYQVSFHLKFYANAHIVGIELTSYTDNYFIHYQS
jgi:hypothetical protein